jgi:DNA topoisomerase-2
MSDLRKITIQGLFNNEVREYSVYANIRAIPSIMDGFKPSQRKVIFGAMKRAASTPETGIKVSQLAAAISEVSHYHHGEVSLEGAIVGMAQDFSGSNNLNYLEPIGQFGSRLSPANAASRYIFTKLSPAFRKIFKREDDAILESQVEDGDTIEPKTYLPILPNVLINGASGMGTGFATKILPYNPLDLKKHVMARLKGRNISMKLVPWFRNFNGEVLRLPTGQVQINGKLEVVNTTKILITELPIGVYSDDYKKVLLKLIDDGYIKDYENRSTATRFEFELTVPRTTAYEDMDTLMSKLKLISRESENITVWLPDGKKVRCFKTPEELIDVFVEARLKLYEVRRQKQLELLADDYELLDEKMRFIKLYISKSQEFAKQTKAQLEELLRAEGYKHIDKLLEVKVYNMTKDQLDKLAEALAKVEAELKYYAETTATELYIKDLDELDLSKDLAV